MWMHLRVLPLLLQSRTEEYDGSPTNPNKRLMKHKRHNLLLKVLLQLYHGIVFGTQTLWIHVFASYVMSGSDWGRHSKNCCKTPLENLAVSTAWTISRGPATSTTTGVWNVLCHISRAEEKVMRERVAHHTRSIKTNGGVHLSRKPRADLCYILLQHLQGVCTTYLGPVVFCFLSFTLS